MTRWVLLFALLLGGCTTTGPAPDVAVTPLPPPSPFGSEIPAPIYGWTTDSAWDVPRVMDALNHLRVKTTLRVVLDPGVAPSEYLAPIQQFATKAYIMAELVDSEDIPKYTTAQYLARAQAFYAVLKPYVSIWEVGNEVNGDWTGKPADVVAKVAAAYDYIKSQGGRTALTLYENKGCEDKPQYDMITWVDSNLPGRIKIGTDYAFVSYYEQDCNNLRQDWNTVFQQLSMRFPLSRLGMGEVGTTARLQKAAYLTRYYGMNPAGVPNFVGGYFWWYGFQDLSPSSAPLWKTFNALLPASQTTLYPTKVGPWTTFTKKPPQLPVGR